MLRKFKFFQFFNIKSVLLVIGCIFMQSCATSPPKNVSNLCEIFREKPDWFHAAEAMNKKWGVPVHVPMSMMYQESSFRHDALPPREYVFFGLIPWGRVSSAFGYSQAKTPTWEDYVRESGNSWADRDEFEDAIDFMGWFISKTYKINGISKWDAYAQYLNYHEGWGGYKRRSYQKKKWLMNVAKKVNTRASVYAGQYKSCKDELGHGWLWRLIWG